MMLRNIERTKVMKIILNFRPNLYLKTGLSKNVLNMVEGLRDGVKTSFFRIPSRKRDVNFFIEQSLVQRELFEFLFANLDPFRDPMAATTQE